MFCARRAVRGVVYQIRWRLVSCEQFPSRSALGLVSILAIVHQQSATQTDLQRHRAVFCFHQVLSAMAWTSWLGVECAQAEVCSQVFLKEPRAPFSMLHMHQHTLGSLVYIRNRISPSRSHTERSHEIAHVSDTLH